MTTSRRDDNLHHCYMQANEPFTRELPPCTSIVCSTTAPTLQFMALGNAPYTSIEASAVLTTATTKPLFTTSVLDMAASAYVKPKGATDTRAEAAFV